MVRGARPQKEIAQRLRDYLREKLAGRGVEVETGFNLYYSLSIDSSGRVTTDKVEKGIIRRGGLSSFETDVAAFERPDPSGHAVPRVVVEIALGGVTTHNLMIYSAKAAKHKEIYPYLRYGFVGFGEKSKIHPKVLRHGQHFDFIYIVPADSPREGDLEMLASVISQEIDQSRQLSRYLNRRLPVDERPALMRKPLDFE